MDLDSLLAGIDVIAREPEGSVSINEVRDDSRAVTAGDLFVAVRGQTVDGHAFLDAASDRGAIAAIVDDENAKFSGTRVLVRSAAHALGQIAANRYGRPAEQLGMIGITGTNGKTTCTYLVEAILTASGLSPGVIGTIAYRSPKGSKPAPFTTPTPLQLHATLAEMKQAGCSHVVMECSSHALALGRLVGVDFSIAAFTNLTQDHLDFHGDLAAYAAAKARLFSERLRRDGRAVVCIDGPYGEQMARAASGRVLRVTATDKQAHVCVRFSRARPTQTQLELDTPAGRLTFSSPLVGGFNVENLVVAAGVGVALGLSSATIERALSSATGAPGRLERVQNSLGIAAYVDYAHTPDALARALAALRPTTAGKLWVVFGCGGDRDRGKRPLMGQIAVAGADVVVVTSDNPRSESPDAIIAEILVGAAGARVEPDRRAAIELAVSEAQEGDTILVAGKGHEDYQIVGSERRHFDDREELARALQRRAPARG